MNTTRTIDLIVIHCSATPNGRWTSTLDIDHWHAERGFRRDPSAAARFNPDLRSIGYHWVLYPNGARATGRHPSEVGAHARGVNSRSLGLCLVGTDRFTYPQWGALLDQVRHLCATHRVPLQLATAATGYRGVCGHRDLAGVNKACPGFDVGDWLAGDMLPLRNHLLELPK
ncbi:N-acetylmuramoyl-L-alanine amidase [Aromatoleum toluclasticum]|uniref:N-acetylmuramoyl-L-alanine amidase n=1 Tax=Aromatoleum toluclasticum TaxID=92003 RepID=UPI001D196574|nr:N-acetylmuramoyl-L-alanine amidase [Aromatoleum toluclasticum]MCC4116370.1 N-acetylmuramoyl-L-alanine amidase [Aromatoleum toluclasticum]